MILFLSAQVKKNDLSKIGHDQVFSIKYNKICHKRYF